MTTFYSQMRRHQVNWRIATLPHIKENGWQNNKQYDHILPWANHQANFYPPIREKLFGYIRAERIQPHTGIHNLLSSWAFCANMYWPFNNENGKQLLANYLSERMGIQIATVYKMHLEYDHPTMPTAKLLGEGGGQRGTYQTSADLAIEFGLADGRKGLLLVESKFTEQNFGFCSASGQLNPAPGGCCNTKGILDSNFTDCHLLAWRRKYWTYLEDHLDYGLYAGLELCPMMAGVYQLFRQQALAEALKTHFDLVISSVFVDSRNEEIQRVGLSAGLGSLPEGWAQLFPNLPFAWLIHNDWYEYVKLNDVTGEWADWLNYVGPRYFQV